MSSEIYCINGICFYWINLLKWSDYIKDITFCKTMIYYKLNPNMAIVIQVMTYVQFIRQTHLSKYLSVSSYGDMKQYCLTIA